MSNLAGGERGREGRRKRRGGEGRGGEGRRGEERRGEGEREKTYQSMPNLTLFARRYSTTVFTCPAPSPHCVHGKIYNKQDQKINKYTKI